MILPRIVTGLVLVDDADDEIVVSRVNQSAGVVSLSYTDEEDGYSLSLRELRSKLRDGEFAVVEDSDSDDDQEDEEDGEDEDEGAEDGDDSGTDKDDVDDDE